MKIDYLPSALKALEDAPAVVRKAFFKQVKLLEQDLRYPSLRAKKMTKPTISGRHGSTRTGVSISTSWTRRT